MSCVAVESLLAAGYALFLCAVALGLDTLARHSHRRSELYRTAGFAYDARRDAWECPEGEQLHRIDTDHRTIPNEVGWIDSAVHLNKGCYRGQETVARVHNLGHPPRRLVMLHLDGSADRLPGHGDLVQAGQLAVGFAGGSARHYELGPVALALIKRSVPVTGALEVAGISAAQEVIVPPDVGANVKISLGRRSRPQ